MQKLRDAIESMLREAVLSGSTHAPGWRGEIVTIVEEMIDAEREACAKIVDVGPDVEAWEIHGGQETIDVLRDLAAKIRMRSNVEVSGPEGGLPPKGRARP